MMAAHKDPLAVAELHLDLLYERDVEGCIIRCRNYDGPPPLVHLVRTSEGNRWLLSASIPVDQRTEAHAVLEAMSTDFGDPQHSPPELDALRGVLVSDGQGLQVERGPAFVFPAASEPSGGAALLLDPHDVATVPELAWVHEAKPAEHPLAVARNERDEVVAVCHSARSTGAGAEAGVETALAYQGRGLAGEVVRVWAEAVRGQGRLPLYSTDWANSASRAVARKLGLVMYGEDCRIDIEAATPAV